MKTMFAPSLMCMDICDTLHQLEVFERYCHMLHVDIMDGHFAKNVTLSPGFIRNIRKHTKLPIEAHLMVTSPGDYIDELADCGADFITVHAETVQTEAFRVLGRIKAAGARPGAAICPATPLEAILPYLELLDLVVVMTVDIGYAGQKFIPQMMGKIRELDRIRREQNMDFLIETDGAIGKERYRQLHAAGVNAYVMGTSGLFQPGMDIESAAANMVREFAKATGPEAEQEL